ncbi:MAG TPA: NUDIX hydrolase [Candidatus Acidoferrum sp.]|nr:NUDIX hydrolase [Candidatus Acidoferrum sp.]
MRAAKARVIHSKMLYQGRVFGVRRDRVIEPGGVEVTRDVVTHNGSVVLVPVFPDGSILLVRQYRHPVERFLWELVAGRVERGEAPGIAAKRELQEETGYTAKRFRKLMDVFPTPGFVSENMVVFLAEGLTAGAARPEADEKITAKRFSLARLERMMRTGALRDAKSIAAILFYARFVRRG